MSFTRILWRHLRPELALELERDGYSGYVSFALKVGSRLILTGLGPIGSVLAEISDFLIEPFLRAIGPARQEYERGLYEIKTKNGVAVLQRPELITHQRRPLILPKRLEIPTQKIITPPRLMRYSPTLSSRVGARPIKFSHERPLPIREFWNISGLKIPETSRKALQAINDQATNNVEYPQWLFQKQASPRSAQKTLRDVSRGALAGRYLRPNILPDRKSQRTFSTSQPTPAKRPGSNRRGVIVDIGARKAIRSGAHLYPAGIIEVVGHFNVNDDISIFNEKGVRVAQGITAYSSGEVKKIKGHQSRSIRSLLGVYRGAAVVSNYT